MSVIHLRTDDDGTAVITIDVADRADNLLTPEVAAELAESVEAVLRSGDVRGAILTSAKRSFMGDADWTKLASELECHPGGEPRSVHARTIRNVLRRIETGGKPFAAAINGAALGPGLELCLACHYRVLADDPAAVLGLPQVTYGLLPDCGGTQRLPRLVGIERALPLLLAGKPVSPAQALELGIVHAVVPQARLVAAARHWVVERSSATQPWDRDGFRIPGGAGALASHATRSFMIGMAQLRKLTQDNYPAPPAIMAAVYEGTQLPFERGLEVEARCARPLLASPVARNLVRTLYLGKTRADRLERRPKDVPASTITRVGILGAGMMGSGIAYAAAAAGIDVILVDAAPELAERGRDRARAIADRETKSGRSTGEAPDGLLARIRPTSDLALLGDCEVIVEAVFEDAAVKAAVMREAETRIAPGATFASNTSTLPISRLATTLACPERFIGVHFFSPVERMPLVEIILGRVTSRQTLARALDFVGRLRKTPIVVNDSPGFYTSRVFCTYIDEGMALLEEGVAPPLIENAARMAGFATGPLAVADEVSLDLQKRVIEQAEADALPQHFLRPHARRIIERFNAIGRLGRKTGGGFHDFPSGGRKRLWPGLAALYPPAPVQPTVEEVGRRLLYIQALEAARCCEEGVVTQPMDADLGAVLGLGYPAWTGGPLSLIDMLGADTFAAACRDLAARHGSRFAPSTWLTDRARCGEVFHPPA